MPQLDVQVSCPVHDSFRVQQIVGMFDLPASRERTERFHVELPALSEAWEIGLIVGPSGSGKSSIAAAAYGVPVRGLDAWPADRAVIDALDAVSLPHAVELFTAVGFSSPPSWIKPYQVLSGGERFRCDLARALGTAAQPPESDRPLAVFDEFTSVVDRNVAKVCSAAIARGVRRHRIACRFVAVTCHYDVAEWLEPDWVLDMSNCQLARGRLRRPRLELSIHRGDRSMWGMFKRHHYLSGALNPGARVYVAVYNGVPVNLCATLPLVGYRQRRRFTRIVTLPDYQGIGIGMRAMAAVAAIEWAAGYRVSVTSSHPALIGHCRRSPRWRTTHVKKAGSEKARDGKFRHYRSAAARAVVSFEFVGYGGL